MNIVQEHKTVESMLSAWDAGDPVWSITMGGLGPSYEQCIQIAAMEMARAGKEFNPSGHDNRDKKAWEELCYKAIQEVDDILHLSGAQYGAAKNLAWLWCCELGPDGLFQKMKQDGNLDRCIQICKYFPYLD